MARRAPGATRAGSPSPFFRRSDIITHVAEERLDITRLLQAWNRGEQGAEEELAPFLYRELRVLADKYLRAERQGHTLQPTALIHEVYLRLVRQSCPDFENRTHFYGIAARLMRQVLVDAARARKTAKRSAPQLETLVTGVAWDLLDLDRALARLTPECARAIDLYFFGGLTVPEIAHLTNASERTVARQLRQAKLDLARSLGAHA